MLERRWIVAPAFLLLQALIVHLATGREYLPAPPKLDAFPDRIAGWHRAGDDPIPPEVLAQLNADVVLSRNYAAPSAGTTANLFVAWFQSQRGGARQPHSPKVCLPGNGWTPSSSGEVDIQTAAGVLTANRLTASSRGERVAVLYWFQTPRRTIAGEWAAKMWLMADAVRDHRTDTALVRVVVPIAKEGDDQALAEAIGFARDAHPLLRKYLP
jgi:EpsI family protein